MNQWFYAHYVGLDAVVLAKVVVFCFALTSVSFALFLAAIVIHRLGLKSLRAELTEKWATELGEERRSRRSHDAELRTDVDELIVESGANAEWIDSFAKRSKVHKPKRKKD